MKPKHLLTAATFQIGHLPKLKGWHDPSERWNGYPIPFFEKKELEIIIKSINELQPKPAFIARGDWFEATSEGIQEGYSDLHTQGDKLYRFDQGWMWSCATGHPTQAEELARLHHNLANAIADKARHDKQLEEAEAQLESAHMNASTAEAMLEAAEHELEAAQRSQKCRDAEGDIEPQRFVVFSSHYPEDRAAREAGELDDHWQVEESREDAEAAMRQIKADDDGNLHSAGIAPILHGTDWQKIQ